MARTIKRTQPEDRHWYVPDIDDNRSDDDPFKVLIGPADGATLRKIRSQSRTKVTKSLDAIEAFEQRESRLHYRVVSENVYDVEGYTTENAITGEIITPKDGPSLVEAINAPGIPEGEYAILDNIYEAIVSGSVLEGGLEKKLKPPCDSSSAETSGGSSGPAQSAKDQNTATGTNSESSGTATAPVRISYSA